MPEHPAAYDAPLDIRIAGRRFVIYDETSEQREIVGYCRVCGVHPDDEVMLVSPQGVAHQAEQDTTDCGHNATGLDWWWRL
jgi:hypothetical protein